MINKNVLVSIIIPVYNVAHFLKDALDSVINQSYSHLEIIIVDDGSTDGSSEICDEYYKSDERIRLVHLNNKGLSIARNVGLDMMTGDVVSFIDPDDALHPDFINAMIIAMTNSRADLVLCKYSIQYTVKDIRQKSFRRSYPDIKPGCYNRDSSITALYDNEINANVWNKLYRSELWKDIRFPDGHVFEDNEIAYKIICMCEKVCVIEQTLYFHRKHLGSITESLSLSSICDQLLSLHKVGLFIESNTPNLFSEEQLKSYSQKQISGMLTCFFRTYRTKEHEKYAFGVFLRKQIVAFKERGEINIVGWKKRIGFMLVKHCPFLIELFSPMYNFVRLYIWRLRK